MTNLIITASPLALTLHLANGEVFVQPVCTCSSVSGTVVHHQHQIRCSCYVHTYVLDQNLSYQTWSCDNLSYQIWSCDNLSYQTWSCHNLLHWLKYSSLKVKTPNCATVQRTVAHATHLGWYKELCVQSRQLDPTTPPVV